MEDASKLQGYLMKEKSKFGRLHGLTGDTNKRYFRIQSVEGSEELALCYYKDINGPEVRGWIYLKDVTEIAEDQDTIIITSAARTLHLYAQTRAQHNAWVTGLAKLCPDAFFILGRNASLGRVGKDVSTSGPVHISPIKTGLSNTLLADEHDKLVVDPQQHPIVDDAESSPSINHSDAQAESFGTPREPKMRHNGRRLGKSTGNHRVPGERPVSWNKPRRVEKVGDDRSTKGPYHRHRLSHDGISLHRVGNSFINGGESDEERRTRCRKEERRGHRLKLKGSGDQSTAKGFNFEQDDIIETSASPTRDRRSDGGKDDEGNERSMESLHPPSLEASASDKHGHENLADKWDTEKLAQVEGIDGKPGTDGHGIVVVRPKACGDETTIQSRVYSSDNENVETIELDGDQRPNIVQTGKAQEEGSLAPSHLPRGSNQDEEEKEPGEEQEIDLIVPHLEIGVWEGPHQGQSVTSRLHQHISRSSAECMDFRGTAPPPKEFLADTLIKSPIKQKRQPGGVNEIAAQINGSESSCSDRLVKPMPNGRRRSAADLEWNDGGETPDRPRCTEVQVTHSAGSMPADLGDSEDDGDNTLNLEIEKQRRRAAAAVLALETAAKEADEGAQVESEAVGDGKRNCRGGARRIIAKAYPLPAGPPPSDFLRKPRRGHGVPLSGVAQPKTAPPARAKPTSRRTDPDESFLREDWDNEKKTPCHASPVTGEIGAGGLPPADDAASGVPRQMAGPSEANWMHSDD